MWQYFWVYQTDLPPGIGVDLFSATHLAWVFTASLLIYLIALLYCKQNKIIRRRMEIVIAILLLSGYLIRWIWAIWIGHFDPTDMLPLHLCALSAMAEFIAVFSRNLTLKEFGYACGVPGALATFILPSFGAYPLFHVYYLVFILDHSILILLPLIWIWGDGFRPDSRRLLRCFAIVLFMAGIDVMVNKLINSNFMFINGVPDGTIYKPIADWFGNPGYQFPLTLVLLLVWGIFYAPWMLKRKKAASRLKAGQKAGNQAGK